MKLELNIIFTYDIKDKNTRTGEISSFKTIDDLKLAIKNGRDYFQMPYVLNVTRTVQIIEPDLPKETSHGITSTSYVHPHAHVLKREGFDFIVSDKLTYPHDVREFLTKRYGNVLNFDYERQWDENKPVFLNDVIENTQYGLRDSKTGAPTQYTLRNVVCYPLTDKHVVIDSNLNQIWPTKTGMMPKVLTELLSKNTTEIIQR